MAHVLIVTLGPVQDFIAAARRSRDLWFGSWLLSDLSKGAAEAMARECGLESLVFPGIDELDELRIDKQTSAANKIVVRVPDGKDPAEVARRGQEGMQARLERSRKEAFDWIDSDSPYFDRDRAELQVRDLIEYSWVSAPERNGEGYSGARRKAEELLASRKNTRLWKPVAWGGDVPKSSIDGERESVLYEKLFEKAQEKKITPRQIREEYGVGPTERLCGVGLLKRHGTRPGSRYTHRFVSTGHVAARPLFVRTQDENPPPDLLEAWQKYLRVLAQEGVPLKEQEIVQGPAWQHRLFGPYDGSLLFDNRLPELFEEETDEKKKKEAVRKARLALAAVLEKIGVTTPLPYYAILVADGDRMGKAIERQDTVEHHQKLSGALDGFARYARLIVERDHGGELIYSGGDDVLAFVPLHNAVKCARKLAKDFHDRLSGFPVNEEGEEKETPTLSAGLGISHFLEPLRRALNTARQAEKLAKKKRNSLAVIVDKRSGPPVEVTGVWTTLDLELEDYVSMHRNEQVPDGAAYELRELARLLDRAPAESEGDLKELVRKEAVRILRRKAPERGAKEVIDPKILERLEKRVGNKEASVKEIANRLIVARLLAQAEDEAGLPKSEGEAQ
jgi:CRISPR-associated protein Cmr2